MVNIFLSETDIDNWVTALKSTMGPLHCFKISWSLVRQQLKVGPESTHPQYFVSSPVHLTHSKRH